MKRKLISLFIAAVLVVMLLPVQAIASATVVSELYVGRAYSNESLDTVNGAQGYKYDKSLLPPGLSLSGSYKYNSNLDSDVFTLAMSGTPTTAGSYSFTVTYKKADGTVVATKTYTAEVSATAPFSYVDKNSVSLIKWPTKYKGYYLGETIDFTGMKVTATVYKLISGNKYEEINNYDITSCCFTDKTILMSDEAQSVKVYCNLPTLSIDDDGEITSRSDTPERIECGSFRVEDFKYAGPNDITSMKVKTTPDKMEYTVGESFDPTGMVLEVTLGSGSTNEVTSDYTVDVTELTEEGEKTVNITYKEVSTSLVVNVKAPEESSSSESSESVSEAPVSEVSSEPEAVESTVSSEPEVSSESEVSSEPEVVESVPEDTITPEPEVVSEPVNEKTSIPFWVWIIVALAAVIIIGCVVFFIIGKKKIEEDDDAEDDI